MSEGGEGTCLNFDGLEEVDVLLVRIQFEEGTGDVDEVGLGGVVVARKLESDCGHGVKVLGVLDCSH